MYEVEIQAAVPKRLEWKLIPDAVITRVVEDVVQRRRTKSPIRSSPARWTGCAHSIRPETRYLR